MYSQKVVWIGTVLGDSSVEDFEEFFLKELGFNVKYDCEFKVQDGDYKGLNCIVFGLCGKQVPKFAMFRVTTDDMKWFEDFVDNEGVDSLTQDVYDRYKDYLN